MATPTKGDWITVTRRRRPKTLQTQAPPPPLKTETIIPYLTKPTFAQVLRTPSPQKPSQLTTGTSQPIVQTTQTCTRFFQLPNSPTKLRYPPSPHFQEWWGRCFRCARTGHVASECRNPVRCLYCARDGHKTNDCNKLRSDSDKAATPFQPAKTAQKVVGNVELKKKQEASFHELLGAKEPTEPPIMPENRPKEVTCYFHRDGDYFVHAERLDRGFVVIPTEKQESAPSLDYIAELAASSKMVSASQVQVGLLSSNRYLVLLPEGVNRDAVVRAIPRDAWEQGFTFQSYSPLFDASIDVPFFKIWIDLEGVPIELWRESDIAKAVSGFGMYLGSMEPAMQGNFRTWSVFVAISDLKEVPLTLRLKVGGMVFLVDVIPRKWTQGAIYKASDLLLMPIKYNPPVNSPPAWSNSEGIDGRVAIKRPRWYEEDELIPMSLTTLKNIFQGVDMADIPSDLAACSAGDKDAIRASKLAYREWEAQQFSSNQPQLAMPKSAVGNTKEPSIASQQISTPACATENQAKSLCLMNGLSQDVHKSRDEDTPPNPSITTTKSKGECSLLMTFPQFDPLEEFNKNSELSSSVGKEKRWDPSILFPELGIVIPFNPGKTVITNQSNRQRKDRRVKQQNPPTASKSRRSVKLNAKGKGASTLENLDPTAFVDVPLQYSEGRDLLALIGSSHIPIPPNLMQQAQDSISRAAHLTDGSNLSEPIAPTIESIQEPTTSRGRRRKTLARDPLIVGPLVETRREQSSASVGELENAISSYDAEMVNLHLDSDDEDEDEGEV